MIKNNRFNFILLCCLLLQAGLHAQVLIVQPAQTIHEETTRPCQRMFREDLVFSIVPDTTGLNGNAWTLVDRDPESGSYYWVESEGIAIVQEIAENRSVSILWEGKNAVLVRTDDRLIITDFVPERYCLPVHFHDHPLPVKRSQLLKARIPRVSLAGMQSILASINIDSLLLTEAHLTGISPYEIGGVEDSMLTRYSYAPGIYKAQAYLHLRLENWGYPVTLEPFTLAKSVSMVNLNNVVATKTGTVYPDNFVILCAHYDATSSSTPWSRAPGADDNGSGTAAVLEAARILKDIDTEYSIRFVFFAGEEQGLVGSAAYAARINARGDNVIGVLNLDMIGYDGNSDGAMEIHSGYQVMASNDLGDAVVDNIARWNLDLSAWHLTTNASNRSDHASFWTYGIPAILLIEDFTADSNPWYHSAGDLLKNMNVSYFHEMSRLAIGSAAVLAGVDTMTTYVDADSPVRDFRLMDPYPNPFNPLLNIRYQIPSSTSVDLSVFNLLGRKVSTLIDATQSPGDYRATWTGKSNSGRPLPAGVYFIRLRAGQQVMTRKVLYLK